MMNFFSVFKKMTVLLLLIPSLAYAWKPYTHNFIAQGALEDALVDGEVTINGNSYQVNLLVLEALQDYPEFYHAGVIGPDGFPDLTYGQAVVHPGPASSEEAKQRNAFTGAWLDHLLENAWAAQNDTSYSYEEKKQILAFVYGYLSHAAGDLWAHTFINDYADGVFPGIADLASDLFMGDPTKAEHALRHLVAEGYVGSATPGYDGYRQHKDIFDIFSPRTKLPGSDDWSNDSTPGFLYDAPHRFIYNTLISKNAGTPVDDADPDAPKERGPVINFFNDLKSELDGSGFSSSETVEASINEFNELAILLDEWDEVCNNIDHIDDFARCTELTIGLGFEGADDILVLIAASIEDAALVVFDAYVIAWVEDIDNGLIHWSEFGLATTKGLFDAQSKRDVQNAECAIPLIPDGNTYEHILTFQFIERAECEAEVGKIETIFGEHGTANDYINDHLLSMLGAPDFVGDLRAITQDIMGVVDDIFAIVDIPLNPIEAGIDAIQALISELIQQGIEDSIGVDLDVLDDILSNPSHWMCLSETEFNFPDPVGVQTIDLFSPGEHERLDEVLNFDGIDHHHTEDVGEYADCGRLLDTIEFDEEIFAAIKNSINITKLLLLDATQLDQVLSDLLGRNITFYQAVEEQTGKKSNIMITSLVNDESTPQWWLRLIDGDHAWRKDGLPRFCSELESTSSLCAGVTLQEAALPGTSFQTTLNGGNGTFPLWESCVLRPAFRQLFTDWENDSEQFPDLGDAPSSDPSNDPNPPTSYLSFSGTTYDNGSRLFVGSDNSFSLLAHDLPDGYAFADTELGIQYKVYQGSGTSIFQAIEQNGTFHISGRDGQYFVDFQSEDACHTFNENDQMSPEPVQTNDYWLDTAPPAVICNNPPFGMQFDTDDTSMVSYSVDDGTDGAGVQESTSIIDGYLNAQTIEIANYALLEMYHYDPGLRTVTIQGSDNIGNVITGNNLCTFTVRATAESLINNLKRAKFEGKVPDNNVYEGLLDTLKAAHKAHNRKQHSTEHAILTAFINQLNAQQGHGIDLDIARRLITYTRDLITHGG